MSKSERDPANLGVIIFIIVLAIIIFFVMRAQPRADNSPDCDNGTETCNY